MAAMLHGLFVEADKVSLVTFILLN